MSQLKVEITAVTAVAIMDSPRTGTASDFKLAPELRYEHSAGENAIIHLHKLCSPCAKFTTTSSLLQTLARRGRIRILASETAYVGAPIQLKAGYSSGSCHLCALLWDRVAAHLLDPARSARSMDYSSPVAVRLEARDDEKEYAIEVQKGTDWKKKAWWAIAPLPFISDKGYIKLKTTALGREIVGYLYFHQRTRPDLNSDSLRHISVPVSTRNSVNFEVIKKWQMDCTGHHSSCRQFPSVVSPTNQAPSRLLNVSGDNVRLECDVGAMTPALEYTTLSHMWGPDPSLCPQLLASTIDSFMLSISMHDLPKKYVNAIQITRALGFQYIWIDSLCIIQDSKEDWQREAVKMAAVYGRSSCNISYTFPPASESSNNHLRDPRIHLPCHTRLPFKSGLVTSKAPDDLVIQHTPGYIRPAWLPTHFKSVWPLLSRGWVFQERLLCPRTVYYGQDRLIWECCNGIEDEFYGALPTLSGSKVHFYRIITRLTDFLRGGWKLQQQSDSPESSIGETDTTSGEMQWAFLIRDYRAGNLTKESDRGIAFAGIARAIQAKTNVTYLAGLWKEFLEYDLLWSVSPVPVNITDYERVRMESEPAPSWSWFSIPTYKTTLGNDILDFPFRTTMQTYRIFSIYSAKTVSYFHPDSSTNSDSLLYKFADMTLTIRAKRIPCTFQWRDALKLLYVLPLGDYKWVLGMKNVWLKKSQQWARSKCLKYAHDNPLLKEEDQLPQDACMLLTVEQAFYTDGSATQHAYNTKRQQKGDIPDSWSPTYQYAGIVVVPVDSTDAQGLVRWRRIGVFIFSDDIVEESFTTPFDEYGATEEDLVLV
ncbi:het domain-containing protein [Colletotrichum camelliae]|nr:het domain-containing protein [Colletotrichum camelliae]